MSLKQCSGCAAMVDETKAFCANCGNPMDDEQKRSDSSEFEAQAKTQNLNATKHLEILEQFKLSMFFATSQKNLKIAPETKTEPPTSSAKVLDDRERIQSVGQVYELPTWNLKAQQKKAKPNKRIYFAIGAAVILLVLFLILGAIMVNFLF